MTTTPCLLSWCSGRSAAHAGHTPGYNSHYSPEDHFAPRGIFFGCIEQVGDAPPFYRLVPQLPPSKVLLTASETRALADEFERHAETLRGRAAQLEQFGGVA